MSHRPRLISIAAAALVLAGTLVLWPAGAALAAITFQTSSTAQNGNTTTLTISKPSGVQVGDFLLAQITFEKGSDISPLTPPSGWTLVLRTNRSSDIGQAIFYKFAVAADLSATQYTWTFDESAKAAGGIIRYTGVDPTPIGASSGNTGDGSTLTASSVTAAANSRLLALFGVKKTTTLSNPSSMTSIYQVQNPQDITSRASDELRSVAGATGNRTSTASSGDKWIAQLVTLQAAPEPLTVSKTANPAIEQTITWDIEKTVEPDSWDLFTGDTGTSEYTISVDREDVDVYSVSGTITITNPNSSTAATISNITDTVGDVTAIVSNCAIGATPTGGTSFSLPGGQIATCDYSAPLPDGTTRTNTATVTTSGTVAGNQGTAPVNFTNVTPTVADGSYASVSIDDDNDDGDELAVTGDDEYTYEVAYACEADDGTKNNTAAVIGGEDEELASDSASVSVNCYALEVAKTVDEEFTRTWTWGIEKEGDDGTTDQNPLVLAAGQNYEVNYTVTVDAESADSEHKITGTITITNPSPRAATLTVVTDAADDENDTNEDAVCPSLSVPEDGTLDCTYELDLGGDGTATLNTATATLQNFDYDSEGVGTASGTTNFEGTEAVSFDNPSNEVDECANVSDSEDAGTTLPEDSCATEDPHEEPFNYARFIGPFSDPDQCGDQEALNIASFVTEDTDTEDSANHTVFVNVTCENGGGGNGTCTLSQGYWKTHSRQGPAPYDSNWANLGTLEENTIFFAPKNTQTYRQVLWTPPAGGNAYYILAKQYIAAELNGLNGSDLSTVQSAFDTATVLFGQYTPAQIAALKGNNATRKQFLDLAGILGAFNEDNHCDEDETSAP